MAVAATTTEDDHHNADSITYWIARGRSNYHGGQYKQAAEDFARLADVDTAVCWKRNKRPRPEHLLSVQLAWEADAALCRARSYGTPELLKEALRANERYRRVLQGSVAENNRNPIVFNMLLAAVSAIWLHMKLDDIVMARTVAWECLQWACSVVTNTKNAIWTQDEALKLLSQALSNSDHSVRSMAHALSILELVSSRETCCKNVTHGDKKALEEEQESAATSKELIAKQQLLRALSLHKVYLEGDSTARHLRDEYLNGALHGTSLLLARKIPALIKGLEAINKNVCIDAIAEELWQVLRRTIPAELNLLGCLLARSNTTRTKALTTLKEALELSESFGNIQLHRDIVSNLAECFLFLGETRHAKDLLLYLNETPEAEKDSSPATTINLSTQDDGVDDNTTLWRAFLVTSLDQDHITTMILTEKLLQSVSSREHAITSHIFALLQAGRPSLALKASRKERIAVTSLCSIAIDMYEADAMLQTERGFDGSDENGVLRVSSLADSANAHLLLLSTNHSREARMLRATVWNNRGVSQLVGGKTDEALECLRASVKEIDLIEDHGNLQPHFNLCLLLWRKEQVVDAVRVWLSARGMNESPGKMQVGLETHLERSVGKYLAEQRCVNGKDTPVSSWHVPSWQTNGLGCMDQIQVLLMDCIMVQFALEMKNAQIATSSLDELMRHMT